MKHALVALTPIILIAGCSGELSRPGSAGEYRNLKPTAHPSEVITTELAFARLAREKGQWTAFREYSTDDALMATPGFENVHDALRGEADPSESIVWGPDQVWSSCDGSFAVSTGGARYPSGRVARFVTVWQRQRKGDYQWVLDQGVPDPSAPISPDTIAAHVAECAASPASPMPLGRRGENWISNSSDDGTLAWETQVAADCSRTVVVRVRKDGQMDEVFRKTAPAPQPAAGQVAPDCS